MEVRAPLLPHALLPLPVVVVVPVRGKHLFAEVLRKSRKGLSAGLWGARYEYYKLCFEDDTAFDALHAVAERLARAEIPAIIRNVLQNVIPHGAEET